MGFRGKVAEQGRARELRALGWTMPDIAAELGVSRGSVSLWTRDVPFEAVRRGRARQRPPNALQRAKDAEIDRLLAEGRALIGELSERDLLIAGTVLYAGEGDKTRGSVGLANTDPRMIALFCLWLRRFFAVDESRLRVRLYLHEGLDVDAANRFWSTATGIPIDQFNRPYRAVPDATIRHTKHELGCPKVRYNCSRTHRAILGLVDALLACPGLPG
jgi:transcriptional regulator with XRE-family HTH domain